MSDEAPAPKTTNSEDARSVAIRIRGGGDGLPADTTMFQYEKDIIAFYQRLSRFTSNESSAGDTPSVPLNVEELRDKLLKGCPSEWPSVKQKTSQRMIPNPLVPFIGKARDANSHVMVSGLLSGPNTAAVKLTLPEAGPRETLCYPTNAAKKFRVAIMVVGGIAPGINAVIDGIVVVRQLEPYDILYVIGGDGGMRLAHAIRNYAIAEGREGVRELSVIGIPKTMDNDILGCGRRSASCLPWTRPEKLLNISTLR
jgi:hypothetical protein